MYQCLGGVGQGVAQQRKFRDDPLMPVVIICYIGNWGNMFFGVL